MEYTPRKIELLAPARDFEQGRAALLCGADALYIGAPRFGARASVGVSVEEIGRLARLAHGFGARLYVTMNTLLFESELSQAEAMARALIEQGIDALIVQDMAFLRMSLPPVELHASTQMCNIDPQRVAFLREVGFSRVVTERALTLEQIRAVAEASKMEVEAFVHGAICVSYSGRCYLSRTMSARSGNRGVCSQSCRLPFSLVDSLGRTLLRNKHLLSLQDMDLSSRLEAMLEAGVSSFKIEGRLKDMAYVRNVVSHYRRALDEVLARNKQWCRASEGTSKCDFATDPSKSFSRGATTYYIDGLKPGVASHDTPKSLGEYLGRVSRVDRAYLEVDRLPRGVELHAGDGVCFLDRSGTLLGTNLNRAEGKRLYLNKMDGVVQGEKLYRNYDHQFVTELTRARLQRQIQAQARVEVEPERVTFTLSASSEQVSVAREGVFEPAKQAERAEQTLRTQLTKSGDTMFTIGELEVLSSPMRFVPIGVLNELRREATQELEQRLSARKLPATVLPENLQARLSETHLSGRENVVNSLSERFYREHGVAQIEQGYDLREDLDGCAVMEMSYCLRRELGECLKEGSKLPDPLFLEHANYRYELKFNCAQCRVSLIYRSGQNRTNKHPKNGG